MAGTHQPLKEKGEQLEQEESSPMEDLMREHGVIERIFLIYQRILEKSITGQEIDISVINRASHIVDRYISNHHEHNEENYIFPKFREANYIVELVDTLEHQHDVSRELNHQIMDLSSQSADISQEDLVRLLDRCGMFINMYLPHISRENTILFPTFFDIVSNEYIQEVKERMEDEEEQVLGDTGFRGLIGRVSELEKKIGCYELSQYTAYLKEPDTVDQP
ncbi:MAG TPA: hemerythrin domain-containing protein [Methanocella sp.]|uniref:hemerythrin domain-containing protein n=1 Tax=Methanocella sp. TaxID=2052833 RepID=UPI002C35FD5D|nr:hemerythrin domain-containing protein [Methanocella sp.]HTY91404.1 hemerythrin domain-containing protein [Methanocella sp.]